MKYFAKALLAASALTMVVVGSAQAGGFARGTADTDIIFEEGNFNMRSSVTFVSPTRKFSQHGNPALVGTDYADSYIIPSAAIKLNVVDAFRCAGTVVQNNGGAADYAAPTLTGKLVEDFTTTETALTCGAKFDIGRGSAWLLGGGYMEQFDYERINVTPVVPGAVVMPNTNLDLQGTEYGYRVGAAYEIKDIAFRAQVMYRSGTEYGANGNLAVPTGALLGAQAQRAGETALALKAQAQAAAMSGNLALAQQLGAQAAAAGTQAQTLLKQAQGAAAAGMVSNLPAIGTGELPQSFEVKVQSGVAPGWLAFGSVKWTDWSATTQLIATAPSIGLTQPNDYFWRDGWTVTGGVGHAFNDKVSGLLALTYDRGVGTGWDLSSDTWTVSSGVSLKDTFGGELRAGGGVSYLTSACETKYAPGENACVDAGWAVAGNIGYSIKW